MDKDEKHPKGQQGINSKVLKQGLCTGCTACVGLCSSMEYYKDKTILFHDCDLDKGRCFSYCPRTPTDLEALRCALFKTEDLVWEIGPIKGLYMTRATDKTIRAGAQHGGTITALIQLALSQGIIDESILADQDDTFLPNAQPIADIAGVVNKAGSKFVVSPTLSAFNRISNADSGKIGVVATPCQATALAKMRVNPASQDKARMEKLTLVIGLFCGWALDWRRMQKLLKDRVRNLKVESIDILPSKHACMEVVTSDEIVKIPINDVQNCVRDNCNYCFDMTCEFADISVGSARSEEGWDVDKGWNQVIVRTSMGAKLLALAQRKSVLEFKEISNKNIEKLKKASAKKKYTCVKNLAQKTGKADDLIYIDPEDPVVRKLKPLI